MVYDAAGITMPLGSFVEHLPPDADLLEPEQRRVVYDVVRAFARQNRELYELRGQDEEVVGNAEHPAPTNQAGPAPAPDDYDLAARPGTPAHPADTTTGEEDQDPGGDEPA